MNRLASAAKLPATNSQRSASYAELARRPLRGPAVVVDYELLSSGTARLTGGTTWFVSGLVNVTNLVIEGTAVVKFTNSASAKINVTGTLDRQTGPYRPAIFTSQYDTSVGESIGSGTVTNYPGALVINTTGNVLHDLRISYATTGVGLGFNSGQIILSHVQFVNCAYPLDSAEQNDNTIIVDNGMFFRSQYVVRGGQDLTVRGRHITVNQCSYVGYTGFGSTTGDLYLTNSLIVAATNGWGQFESVQGSVTTNRTAYFTNDPGGIFQTVGAGSHYLAHTNYRNAGTTNLNADLLAALRIKTTYPPIVLSNASFSASTNLALQAARDTDLPDLGFHYDPLDWLCSQISPGIATVTITFTNGVAVGLYGSYGFSLRENNRFISEGRPEAMNRIVWYPSVQEQPV